MSNIPGKSRPKPGVFPVGMTFGYVTVTTDSLRTVMNVPMAAEQILGTDSEGNPVAWNVSALKGQQGNIGGIGPIGPAGPPGSAALATPLGSATPQVLGTPTAGTSSNASREDHVHAAPTGVNTLLGTATIAESGLTLLALSVRRVTVSVSGATTGSNYSVFPVNALPAGFGIVDAICTITGQIVFGMLVPIITGSYSIPVRIVKVST